MADHAQARCLLIRTGLDQADAVLQGRELWVAQQIGYIAHRGRERIRHRLHGE